MNRLTTEKSTEKIDREKEWEEHKSLLFRGLRPLRIIPHGTAKQSQSLLHLAALTFLPPPVFAAPSATLSGPGFRDFFVRIAA